MLHRSFNSSRWLRHAFNEDEFIEAINMSEDNEYIMTGFEEEADDDRPLALTFIDEDMHGFQRPGIEYFYIQDDEGLILAALTIENLDEIDIEQVSVRPEYQGHGLSRLMLHAVMQYAGALKKPLKEPYYTPEGKRAFCDFFLEMHPNIPLLAVHYRGDNAPVRGFELQDLRDAPTRHNHLV